MFTVQEGGQLSSIIEEGILAWEVTLRELSFEPLTKIRVAREYITKWMA